MAQRHFRRCVFGVFGGSFRRTRGHEMHIVRGRFFFVVALLVGCSGLLSAEQTTVPASAVAAGIRPTTEMEESDPVGRLIAQSNAIVWGKVVASRVIVVEHVKVGEQSLPIVETELTIDVLQRIKGIAFPQHARVILPEKCLLQEGKCFGSTIKEGEELIFFLRLSRTGRWVAQGASEGVQRVVEDRLVVSNLGVADLVSRVGKNIPQVLPKGPTPESR